ncbi:MAG TPA: substrate-binding domain-containing protein [Vicinamibacteria bacterium]|nr:substrate-binding domain-containing protein [Vicinamibacteria bacterium]
MPRRLLCLLGLAALVAVGCAKGERATRRVVGVTLLTQTHDFFKELEQSLRQEAAHRGIELIVTSCEMDPARQASQIEDFVAQRVSAILAAPCDSSAIVANLAAAESAGIPVFTVDIAARGGRVVSHVASDNVQGGRLAAQALARYAGGKGKILVIDHPTVASVQDRIRGFEEELKKHPDITIVGRPSADGQRAKAMAIMEDMLQAHRDLKGVFGINDDSALGALAVLEAAGRQDVVIVGFDATPDAQRAIRSGGPLKADVIQNPAKIGRTALEMVARHLSGETVPPVVAVEVALFEKDSSAGS